jgi:ABC-type glutathione transport system ATPase component
MSRPTPAGTLVIIRGNSGSGKSSVARELVGSRSGRVALVEQDYLRRNILGEEDVEGADNIALIEQTVRFALDREYLVVLEGILDTRRYADMLARVAAAARTCLVCYLDVSLQESLRRHATKEQKEFGEADLRRWYRPSDLCGLPGEVVIPESTALADTVLLIQAGIPKAQGLR